MITMDVSNLLVGVILAFVRIASFLFFVPFLKGNYIPAITKISVSLALAFIVADELGNVPVHSAFDLFLLILAQFLIGITLAFVIEMLFSISRIAGAILDMDMGFSSSQILDPAGGQRVTVISNIYYMLFVIIFVSLGGLSQLVIGIIYSFKFTQPEFFLSNPKFIEMILSIFAYMLTMGIQIALPMTVSMFMVNFILLVLGRTAPQMNIFLNMFAIKIALGFIFIYLSLPFLEEIFAQLNDIILEKYLEVLEIIFTK